VIASQHDGQEAAMPEAADFFTGPGQPLTGATTTELAVAQVGHAEVFQIPLEDFSVGDTIRAVDVAGSALGDYVVPATVMMCAVGPLAPTTPGCLDQVQLGDLRRRVLAVIHLP